MTYAAGVDLSAYLPSVQKVHLRSWKTDEDLTWFPPSPPSSCCVPSLRTQLQLLPDFDRAWNDGKLQTSRTPTLATPPLIPVHVGGGPPAHRCWQLLPALTGAWSSSEK